MTGPRYEKMRRLILDKKYGLDWHEYEDLLAHQDGRCQICNREFTEQLPACVDHDHKSGEVRGLLCQKCNLGLGFFDDSIRLLATAIVYLQNAESMIDDR